MFAGDRYGLVEDQLHEPGSERPAGVEGADPLEGPHERALRDVLGQRRVAHHQVSCPRGAGVVSIDQHLQPADVTPPEAIRRCAFVHPLPFPASGSREPSAGAPCLLIWRGDRKGSVVGY